MQEYEFTDKDYQNVYEHAVREFNHNGMSVRQTYANFLTRCILKSVLSYMKANNIEVRDGKLYVSKTEY